MSKSNAPLESRNGIPEEVSLIERVVERQNMVDGYLRVVRNKGSAGIDKMTVTELKPFLQKSWAKIKKELLEGTYHPKMVKRVEIPKPSGGIRQLGVPTAVIHMNPTGPSTSTESNIRLRIFNRQLWFQAGKERP